MKRCLLAVMCLLGALGVVACSAPKPASVSATPAPAAGPTSSATAEPTRPPTARPTVTPTARSRAEVTKVLVFVEENHSLTQMKAAMPYTFELAQRFGYATDYTAIRHPSEPNYIAITGGQTYGITNDDDPSANPVPGTSVFGQALAAGRTAGLYADGMQSNCATRDGGDRYAVKHNPWAFYTAERDACGRFDVPVDHLADAIAGGTLPNVGMVIPNLCNDAHDCTLGTADRSLQAPSWGVPVHQVHPPITRNRAGAIRIIRKITPRMLIGIDNFSPTAFACAISSLSIAARIAADRARNWP